MYINEIEVNSSIAIKVADKLSLDTEVIELSKDSEFKYILCNPIIHEGKVLQFPDVKVTVEYTDVKKHRHYVFDGLKILYHQQKNVYVISSTNPGLLVNRRGAFRVSLLDTGFISVDGSIYECYIRDISETGIGITTKFKADKLGIGESTQVSFDNKVTGKHYNIKCRIVSIRELSDDRYVYGCILEISRNEVSSLVRDVQRYNLATKRR
jgi:hypothetical protein